MVLYRHTRTQLMSETVHSQTCSLAPIIMGYAHQDSIRTNVLNLTKTTLTVRMGCLINSMNPSSQIAMTAQWSLTVMMSAVWHPHKELTAGNH